MAALEKIFRLQPRPSDAQLKEALATELLQWRQNWRAAIPTLTLHFKPVLV